MRTGHGRAWVIALPGVFLALALPTLAGKWKGETTQDLPILYKLRKDGSIKVLKFNYFVSTPFGIACTYKIRMKNPDIPIEPDGSFDTDITVAGSIGSIDANVSGFFNGRMNRGGGEWDGGSFFLNCGRGTIIGGTAAPDYDYEVKKKKKKKTKDVAPTLTRALEPQRSGPSEALDPRRGQTLRAWAADDGAGLAVFIRRHDISGAPIGAAVRLSASGPFSPVAAFDPDRRAFLVTYSDGVHNFVQVVGRDGAVLDPPVPLGAARPIVEADIDIERSEPAH